MRVQHEEERLRLLGFGIPQRRPYQRDAVRANVGTEPAGHGGHAEELEEVIDATIGDHVVEPRQVFLAGGPVFLASEQVAPASRIARGCFGRREVTN